MLVHLAHPRFGFHRTFAYGLVLVLGASVLARTGFAVDGKSVLDADAAKAKAETDKDQAKDQRKDQTSPVAKKSAGKKDATLQDGAKAPAKAAAKPGEKAADTSKNLDKTPADANKAVEPEIDYSSNAPIDPLPALGDGPDDFHDIDKRAAENAKEALIESDDARVERELKEYKEQEAKAMADQAKEDAKAREAARVSLGDDSAKGRKIKSEADKKAAELKGIDAEELNWKGLED